MIVSENFRLIEPLPVLDTFVSGLGMAENVGGGCFRFVFVTRHGDSNEAIVTAKLIAPIEAVPPAIILAAKAVGYSVAANAYFPVMGLH